MYKLSLKTRLKMSQARTKEKHPNWKGGFSISPGGYLLRRVAKKTYVLDHRYIMEKHIGRNLDKSELVHHINGNKLDNRIENLQILSWSAHAKQHNFLYEINSEKIKNRKTGTHQRCSNCEKVRILHSLKYFLCRPCYRKIHLNNK